ncbi:hypothetical protein BaRGS_00022754 [Batillaria attramentaria]|uniref:Uncharacterized protein n=1 Tax=Batillaria attramentaria TaxID=370345 RepID=A0ABD0KG23_9CAEN
MAVGAFCLHCRLTGAHSNYEPRERGMINPKLPLKACCQPMKQNQCLHDSELCAFPEGLFPFAKSQHALRPRGRKSIKKCGLELRVKKRLTAMAWVWRNLDMTVARPVIL